MPETREQFCDFKSAGYAEETFQLVHLFGREALSELYRFEVDVVSPDPDIDLELIVNQPATIILDREGDLVRFQGIMASFEQRDRGPEFVNYHGVMVPKLFRLGLTTQCRIFLDKDMKAILEEVLKGNGLVSGQDYKIELSGSYPASEYVVQYQESDLSFIRRLMEHEGIFFYFQHGEEKEKLVIGDNAKAFEAIPGDPEVPFRDARSHSTAGEAVGSFLLRQQLLTKDVILKDYNYRKPSLEVKGKNDAVAKGVGTQMEYGGHFKDPDAGAKLAKVRAEELMCREKLYLGRSGRRAFSPGFTFTLKDHFRAANNMEYLLVDVVHQVEQLGVIGTASAGTADVPFYENEFTAIPSSVPFRPARLTPRPRINGVMHAVVDAGGSGRYAELDDTGRYKVKLPFDLSDASGGKASRYIRMAQPYAGPGWGMHFPLHKGCEVILAHIDGDPDRPIIAAAVPNPANASPVTGPNQTQCVLKSCSNNEFRYENTEGSEEIYLHGQKDWRIVIENDKLQKIGHDESREVGHDHTIKIGNDKTQDVGHDDSLKVGNDQSVTIGHDQSFEIGNDLNISVGGNRGLSVGKANSETVGTNESLTIGGERSKSVGAGDSETIGGAKNITVGADYTADIRANMSISVGGNLSESVQGKSAVDISKDSVLTVGGEQSVSVSKDFSLSAKKIKFEAEDEISLVTGDASITMKKNGDITIEGKKITIKGSGDVVIKGSKIAQN